MASNWEKNLFVWVHGDFFPCSALWFSQRKQDLRDCFVFMISRKNNHNEKGKNTVSSVSMSKCQKECFQWAKFQNRWVSATGSSLLQKKTSGGLCNSNLFDNTQSFLQCHLHKAHWHWLLLQMRHFLEILLSPGQQQFLVIRLSWELMHNFSLQWMSKSQRKQLNGNEHTFPWSVSLCLKHHWLPWNNSWSCFCFPASPFAFVVKEGLQSAADFLFLAVPRDCFLFLFSGENWRQCEHCLSCFPELHCNHCRIGKWTWMSLEQLQPKSCDCRSSHETVHLAIDVSAIIWACSLN